MLTTSRTLEVNISDLKINYKRKFINRLAIKNARNVLGKTPKFKENMLSLVVSYNCQLRNM